MSLEPKDWFQILGALITIIISWTTMSNRIETLWNKFRETTEDEKEENNKLWHEITKIRDWISEHEIHAAQKRLEIEKDFGKIREDIIKKDGKLDEILTRLFEINKKIDKLEQIR